MTPEQFKKARKSLGLTQDEMARALGYGNKQRVSELETGKRKVTETIEILVKLYLDGAKYDWRVSSAEKRSK